MLTVPARTPAAPIPQIALPTMNDNELGAAPQIAQAASNSPILQRKMILTEKSLYSFPNRSWNAQHVSK